MATLPIGPFKPAAPARAAVITFPERGISEDWLAVGIGLLVFVLSLGLLFGADLLGWVNHIGLDKPGQGARPSL